AVSRGRCRIACGCRAPRGRRFRAGRAAAGERPPPCAARAHMGPRRPTVRSRLPPAVDGRFRTSQDHMKRLSGLQSSMLRAAGRILSPGGHYGSLLVLIYHRVLPAPDPLLADEPDASLFAAQMDLLADHFNVIGLSEAAERLARRSLPPRAV